MRFTLKNGGRMVDAHAIAELSWAVENYLNAVMDGIQSMVKRVCVLLLMLLIGYQQ